MAEGETSPFGSVFTNFAEIDRKLKAYHKSCDRLAVLIGKAEEGKTADWTLMRASLKEAGFDKFVDKINNLALKGDVCCFSVVVRLRVSYLNYALKAKLDPQLRV